MKPRPEVAFAFVIGALLPCLETLRRGLHMWLTDATTMFEDYFAGGLLLGAGALAVRGHARAGLALTVPGPTPRG